MEFLERAGGVNCKLARGHVRVTIQQALNLLLLVVVVLPSWIYAHKIFGVRSEPLSQILRIRNMKWHKVIERSWWLGLIYLFIYLYFAHICSGRNWIQNVSTTGQVLDNRKLVICGPQRRTGSLQLNCLAEKGCIIAPRNVMTALWCRSAFPDSDFNQ